MGKFNNRHQQPQKGKRNNLRADRIAPRSDENGRSLIVWLGKGRMRTTCAPRIAGSKLQQSSPRPPKSDAWGCCLDQARVRAKECNNSTITRNNLIKYSGSIYPLFFMIGKKLTAQCRFHMYMKLYTKTSTCIMHHQERNLPYSNGYIMWAPKRKF
jgi:hypothetical protein